MKITQTASCLLVALAGLVGCEKPERNVPIVPIPREVKTYTVFKPGTWWVYQDSSSNIIDSVWVEKSDSTTYILRNGNDVEDKNEQFVITKNSTLDTLHQTVATTTPVCASAIGTGPACWAVVYEQSVRPPHFTGESRAQLVQFRGGLVEGTSAFGTLIVRPQTIGSFSYSNVVKVIGNAREFGLNRTATYEWAPGIGIVRRRVALPQGPGYRTWVLVRSQIVQ